MWGEGSWGGGHALVWSVKVVVGSTWSLVIFFSQKFLSHVLQSPRMFELVVPTLFFILDAKASASEHTIKLLP